MGSLYSRYFKNNIKNQIGLILYFTYIDHLVRAGYLESKRNHLKKQSLIYSYFKYESVPPVTMDRPVERQFSSCNRQSIAIDAESTNNQHQVRRNVASLLQAVNQLASDSVHQLVRLFIYLTDLSKFTSANRANKAHQIVGQKLDDRRTTGRALTKLGNGPNSSMNEEYLIDDCPLNELNKLGTAYRYFSHAAVVVTFLKYVYLNIVEAELFGTNKLNACYVPGRGYLATSFSPSFALLIIFCHVIYRFYLYFIRKSFHIESLIFVLYDEERVKSLESVYNTIKRRQGYNHSKRGDDAIKLHKLFLSNRMFFTKTRLTNQRYAYKLRINRTHKHWLKLNGFVEQTFVMTAVNFIMLIAPLAVLVVLTMLAPKSKETLYAQCSQLSDDSNPIKWSLFSWRGMIWFIADLIDSGWLVIDTIHALAWPLASVVISAQDITYSLQELTESIVATRLRLKQWLLLSKPSELETSIPKSCRSLTSDSNGLARQLALDLNSIHDDILMLQCDINDVLLDMGNVDALVSKMSAFIIFCWLIANTYINRMFLTQNRLVELDSAVQFVQIGGLFGVTCTFAYLSKTHKISRLLYDRICHLIAIDPDHRIKSSWLPVLEFYNKDKPMFSFHLGPWTELTLSNYLKSMTWFLTGALIVIDLFKIQMKQNEGRTIEF